MKTLAVFLIAIISVHAQQAYGPTPRRSLSFLQTAITEESTATVGAGTSDPVPSLFVETEAELSTEEYLNKASLEFLQAFDRPQIETKEGEVIKTRWDVMNNYDTVDFLKHRIESIVLGDKSEKIQAAHAQCMLKIAPKVLDDHRDQQVILNSLWTFCYKDNPEKTLFDVL
jgi:hypothetical protein